MFVLTMTKNTDLANQHVVTMTDLALFDEASSLSQCSLTIKKSMTSI
jgi:hypothetical protein